MPALMAHLFVLREESVVLIRQAPPDGSPARALNLSRRAGVMDSTDLCWASPPAPAQAPGEGLLHEPRPRPFKTCRDASVRVR